MMQEGNGESATLQQLKDEQEEANQIDLQQKIQVANAIRREDMKRRKVWCRTSFRMPQSTHYDNFEEAMEAAKLYSVQSNQSTLQEIQHWEPYTEAQVIDFFYQLSSRHVLEEKELLTLLESYQQTLQTTSIYVVRKKGRGKCKRIAVTNYPRSSLTLLTLLKGLHNAATAEPSLPTALIHFLLHRGTNTEALAIDDAHSITTTPVNDHSTEENGSLSRLQFHQSNEDYERMMVSLEQARARMVFEALQASKRSGSDHPEAEASYPSRPDKTIQLASHLAYHLPCLVYQAFIEFLAEWTQSRTPHMRRIISVERIPFRDVLGTMYYPLVIRQLADYLLHLEVDGSAASKVTDNSNAAAIYPYYTHQMFLVENNRIYRSLLTKRNAVRDKFVAVAMGVQNALLHGIPVIVMGEEEAPRKICTLMEQGVAADTCIPANDIDAGGDEDVVDMQSNEIVEEQGTVMPSSAVSMRQRRKMEVDLIDKMEESEVRPVGIRKQRKSAQVSRKRVHAIFEAISLQLPEADSVVSSPSLETSLLSMSEPCSPSASLVAPVNGALNGSSSDSLSNYARISISSTPSSSRMVFIDNLPIDIHDDRILEVFSRCGDIEALTIFNRRPDLDPGPLPQAELAHRRSRQTKVTLSEIKWQRPKTPVYGLITFATDEGARKAMDDSLRIFGMILQRHPVRSVPSWKMSKLFIEDIPEGQPCVELEYHLSHALEPNIFVCLDAGQDVKSTVNSCEVKFPSFEVAYESYMQLQRKMSILKPTLAESDAISGDHPPCRINWMRTEKDAVKWWSRDYGFD
jgi:hypothetical protein